MKRFAVLLVGLFVCVGAANHFQKEDVATRVAWERNPHTPLSDEHLEANREGLVDDYLSAQRPFHNLDCLKRYAVTDAKRYQACLKSLDRLQPSDEDLRRHDRWVFEITTIKPAAKQIQGLAASGLQAAVVVFGLAFLWVIYLWLAANLFPAVRAKSAAVAAAVGSRAVVMRGESSVKSAARELDDLSRLREHGVITEEEFDTAKARIAERIRGGTGA